MGVFWHAPKKIFWTILFPLNFTDNLFMNMYGTLFCCLTVLTQLCAPQKRMYFCLKTKFILFGPQKLMCGKFMCSFILKLGTTWGSAGASWGPGCFSPKARAPKSINQNAGSLQSRSRCLREHTNILPFHKSNYDFSVHPQRCHFIDRAIADHKLLCKET